MLKRGTLFPIWIKQIITKDAYQNGKKKNKKKNKKRQDRSLRHRRN